jgi:hypothetical protein
MCPDASYFIILLCLPPDKPDNFTRQGPVVQTWVNLTLG